MRQQSIAKDNPARILAAATRLWALDPSATLDQVAREAGVGRATLHRHFPGRADLLRATALAGIHQLGAALDARLLETLSAGDALRAVIDVLVPAGDQLHFLLVATEVYADPEVALAESAVDARIIPVLDRCVPEQVLRADTPMAWRMRAIEALIYAAWTAVANGELAARDAAGLVYDTVLRGFGELQPAPDGGA